MDKYISNIDLVSKEEITSSLYLIVYELERQSATNGFTTKTKYSKILSLLPNEINEQTIFTKLGVNVDKLFHAVIMSMQLLAKDSQVVTVGASDDWETYNVHVDDGHINVDNNVKTTVTNNVATTVTNKPSVSLDEPIDVRVTNYPNP